MAGTIALSPDIRWSAAGWLFDWTLRFIAQQVGDPGVSATLQEVIDENLGWVDMTALPPEARRTVVRKLRDELVSAAEGQLPATLPGRQQVLDHVRELSQLARRLPDA
ncbi:MAG TPA: hypothetical protein VGP96_04935 [Candidatus Dormibacteraeota bacterium]|jgi:hypothetical protein|nr:hypothetical protein [Candidatus Dormibacteraeota bacterium]